MNECLHEDRVTEVVTDRETGVRSWYRQRAIRTTLCPKCGLVFKRVEDKWGSWRQDSIIERLFGNQTS